MFGLGEAMLGFLRRQVGLRTDAADPAGSLHAKVGNLKSDISGISSVLGKGLLPPQAQASDNIRLSSDSQQIEYTANVWVKKKEIIVLRTGFFRVSFDLLTGDADYYVKGRIYRNGDPYGTERQTTSTSYITYTEDLFFEAGDYVQLYVYMSSTYGNAYVRNFRIKYDVMSPTGEGFVLL